MSKIEPDWYYFVQDASGVRIPITETVGGTRWPRYMQVRNKRLNVGERFTIIGLPGFDQVEVVSDKEVRVCWESA